MYDLLIRNVRIVDGTGAAAYSGEVAVAAGKIALVQTTAQGAITGTARRVIDGQGCQPRR